MIPRILILLRHFYGLTIQKNLLSLLTTKLEKSTKIDELKPTEFVVAFGYFLSNLVKGGLNENLY